MSIYNYIKKFLSIFLCFTKDTRFYYLSIMENPNNINGYSIHGLWPQYNEDSYPKYCKEVSFSIEKIETLRKDLELYWTPHNTKDPSKLWSHEWKKHGSCIFSDINQYDYFKISIDLYKEIIDKKLIHKKYNKYGTHYLIPVDLNFKLI